MSSSMASSPTRTSRPPLDEPLPQGAGAISGSFSSSREEILDSKQPDHRQRLHSFGGSGSRASSGQSPGRSPSALPRASKGVRRPANLVDPSPDLTSSSSSRDSNLQKARGEGLAPEGRYERREPWARRPSSPALGHSSVREGFSRSASGPMSVERSKVQKMVGDLEAASQSLPDTSSSLKPPPPPSGSVAASSSSAAIAAMIDRRTMKDTYGTAPTMERSRSASAAGTKAARTAVHNAASSPTASVSESRSSAVSAVPAPAATKSPGVQTKPSLRTRLFGFRPSKGAANPSAAPSSTAASPALHAGPSWKDSLAAASPSLRSGDLLSPTSSSHEFHGSDRSDSASIAHSVRSDSPAALATAGVGPRRSASVNSAAGRSHTGAGTLASPLFHETERSSSQGATTTAKVKAISLRQKVSSGSLHKSIRSPSPSPSVATTSSSIRLTGSETGETSYKPSVGRRGTTYTKQMQDGDTAQAPAASMASLRHREPIDAGHRQGAESMQGPPNHDLRRPTDRSRLDYQHCADRASLESSSNSVTTPNFPTDTSFLMMMSSRARVANASQQSLSGANTVISEHDQLANKGEQNTTQSPFDAPSAASVGRAHRGAPLMPPTRTPPPVPSEPKPEGVRPSSSPKTMQPFHPGLDRSTLSVTSLQLDDAFEGLPSRTSGRSISVSMSDDRPVTPTGQPEATPVRLPDLKSSEALAAATGMTVPSADEEDIVGMTCAAPSAEESLQHSRRRDASRGGPLSRQPSNASSKCSFAQDARECPSPFMPRSSSLHGHGSSFDPSTTLNTRPSPRRGSSHGALPSVGNARVSHPLSPSGSTLGLDTGSPRILPRTTSSSAILTGARPESSHGSPRSPNGHARQHMRMSRPRTADTSHRGNSNSISSVCEMPLSVSAIAEESISGDARTSSKPGTPLSESLHGLWRDWNATIGASPRSPMSPPTVRPMSSSGSGTGAGNSSGGGTLEANRPDLPPKNPLRGQRSANLYPRSESSRSVSDPMHVNSQNRHPFAFASPGLAAETSESLVSNWQNRQRTMHELDATHHVEATVSPWMDSPAVPAASRRMRTETVSTTESDVAIHPLSNGAYVAQQSRNSTNHGIGLGEEAGIPKSLSVGALTRRSSQATPWDPEETLSVKQTIPGGSIPPEGVQEREQNDSAQLTGKKSKLILGSAFKAGRNRSKTVDTNEAGDPSHHEKRRKEGGPGSRIWSFARELGGGDHEGGITSPGGSQRKGRGTKKFKTEPMRPQIRRVFDSAENDHDAGSMPSQLDRRPAEEAGRSLKGRQGPVSPFQEADGDDGTTPPAGTSNGPRLPRLDGGFELDPAFLGPSAGNQLNGTSGSEGTGVRTQGWSINRDQLDEEQKRIVKRWYVMRELLETERSYASDLAVARDVYLARARMLAGIVAPTSPLSASSWSFFNSLSSSPTLSRPQSQARPSPSPQQSQPQRQSQHQHRVPQSLGQPPVIMQPSPQSPARLLLRHASADSNPHALGGVSMAASSTSPASLTSSNPSNRSSTYTVSSLSSQTSDGTSHPLPSLPSGVVGGRSGQPSMSPSGLPTSSGQPARHPSNGSQIASAAPVNRLTSHSSTSLGSSSVPSTASTPTSSTPTTLTPGQMPAVSSAGAGSGAGALAAPLSVADVRVVFAQLEQCAALADEMTAILEVAVGTRCTVTAEEATAMLSAQRVHEKDEDDRIGEAFLRMMPRIDLVYAAYCSRHEASMARLQKLSSSEPKVATFLKDCTEAARKHTNAWDLSSLLIKPVQRVLKYPLLLQEIVANTSDKHQDSDALRLALLEMQKVADHINEVKKRKDLVDQIVAGKSARRSTSQRAQHGTLKKMKRQQEKIKNAVIGTPPDIVAEDHEAFKALVDQLHHLESGIGNFAKQCLDWSEALYGGYSAQIRLLEQWRQVYLLGEQTDLCDGVDERLVVLSVLLKERVLEQFWRQLDGEIRSSIVPMTQRIVLMFANPNSVIAKRNDRELDYTRYRSETARLAGKAPDRKLAESAGAFVALHTQLMDELPQFVYGVQTLVDISIESLARLQAAFYLRVQTALVDFWREHAWAEQDEVRIDPQTQKASMSHLNPVKMFWEVHSNVSAFTENLQIVSRRDDGLLAVAASEVASAGGFSPLQLRQNSPRREASPAPDDETLFMPTLDQLPVSKSEERAGSSRGSFRTASGSRDPTPFSSPPMVPTSPRTEGNEPMLGSPAPITATVAQIGGGPTSTGTFISASGSSSWSRASLKRASQPGSGTSSLVSPRSGGHRAFLEDLVSGAQGKFDDEGDSSVPPTPISKDTPVQRSGKGWDEAAQADKRTSLPVLPVLSFNDEAETFFTASGSSNPPFLERIPERSSSISDHNHEQDSTRTHSTHSLRATDRSGQSMNDAVRTNQNVASAGPLESGRVRYEERRNSPQPSATLAAMAAAGARTRLIHALEGQQGTMMTMAAVRDSPSRSPEAPANSVLGYPLLEYGTGDLFRVIYVDAEDQRFLFGKTERGEMGWAERSAFVPLV